MKKTLTARSIQIILAFFWLIDGFLQLQPQMFTKNFTEQVVAPAAAGQPFFVRGIMDFSIQILSAHTIIFGIMFAVVQLAIGILILIKPTVRIGLIGSILWGSSVWFLGEGAGGIFSGQTSLLMGAPGAALLYVLISIAVYPRKKKETEAHRKFEPAAWLAIVWAVIWIGGAVYQVLPGQNTVGDVGSMITGNADGAPSWLGAIDTHVGGYVTSLGSSRANVMTTASMQMLSMQPNRDSGYWFIILLVALQLLIGALIFLPNRARKGVVLIGIIVSLFFWIVGQSLGEYYSGLATDPNTAPLIILLGLAILGSTQVDDDVRIVWIWIKNHIGLRDRGRVLGTEVLKSTI